MTAAVLMLRRTLESVFVPGAYVSPAAPSTPASTHESTAPDDALERNRAGDYELIHPTLMSLRTLAEYTAVTDVVEALRRQRGVHPHLG